MCVNLSPEVYATYSLGDLLHKPLSAHLLYKTLQLRNGGRSQSCLGVFARTVIGELCFAALAVAVVVECVSRVVFYAMIAIPLLLSEYCIPGAFDRVVLIDLPITLVLLPDLFTRCVAGFIISPFTRMDINMGSLGLCVFN